MSKISLYIDEDAMDEDFLRALRSRNVDVVTPKDVEMLHRSDEDQLTWARENSRVIFTFIYYRSAPIDRTLASGTIEDMHSQTKDNFIDKSFNLSILILRSIGRRF